VRVGSLIFGPLLEPFSPAASSPHDATRAGENGSKGAGAGAGAGGAQRRGGAAAASPAAGSPRFAAEAGPDSPAEAGPDSPRPPGGGALRGESGPASALRFRREGAGAVRAEI
jgi:hypothetical protein